MNTCTREERLTAWLLGDLPSDEAEALRLHLAECAACSSHVAELEPVIAALREGLTAPPPKPLHLFPAQRRRVLATPYQNRFSRWWGADSASILKIAAAVAILAALAASLFPAASSSLDQARSTALKARERAAWVAQISETMERESDEAAFSDLSVQTGAEVPQSHLIVGHQPNGATFTPEIVLEPPPPLADAQPLSPQPAAFDSVMQVKSPLIVSGGSYGTRSAGKRALKSESAAASADQSGTAATFYDDDIAVEVHLPDTELAVRPAGDKRITAEAEDELALLREDVACLEDHAALASSKIRELQGLPPPPPAKPAPARSLATATESELRQRQEAAEKRIAQMHRSIPELRGRISLADTRSQPQTSLAPSSGERTPRDALHAQATEPKPSQSLGKDLAGDDRRTLHRSRLTAEAASDTPKYLDETRPLSPEEATLQRMKAIQIPEINLRSANIADVAAFFAAASREFDDPKLPPEKRGIGFTAQLPATAGAATTPASDDPFAPIDDKSANGESPITFSARYVNLYEAAKIIADVAGLKMRVRGNQVVFVPSVMACSDIVTRSFDVDDKLAAKIEQIQKECPPALRKAEGTVADGAAVDLTTLFLDIGVSLPDGAAVTYIPALRKLRASLPPESLADFEHTLKELSEPETAAAKAPAPPTPHQPAAHNPFIETRVNPFSTFAIDVDTASYTRTRQSLVSGALPDPEAVRTEEIVNAFDYNDRASDNATFRVYIEGAPAPFGAGLDLVRIGVKGRRLGREEQRPAMLTFLVDASGSMDQPDRIGLARQALALLLDQLAPQDRLQLIAFDDRARLLLEATAATDRTAILAAFDRLQCRGSTNLEDGMREAYALAARAFLPGGENRVILISDGVANLGTDSASDILTQIDAYRRQGITCAVFGVGRGAYNDRMLEELANRGDGAYRFLDSPAEVRRAFVDEFAATFNTIATDVKIQVEWAPAAVSRYRQLGYENRALTKEQFRDDTVDAGEVGSGQSVTALYEIERTDRSARAEPLGLVRVRYRRIDTQSIEEIEQPILPSDFAPRIEMARAELRLAACAAEFAELLRRSPHAAGSRFGDVARLLRPAVLELRLDTRVAELARLVELAQAMGD